MGRNTGKCRGADCGAEFEWALNENTGKGVPLNPTPVDDGRFIQTAEHADGRMIVRPLRRDEDPGDADRYMPHHVDCPNAGDFRKAKQ